MWHGSDWVIYVGQEPPSPDKCITVYDAPGREPLYSEGIEHPSVQVRVRASTGAGYLDASGKVRGIKDDLIYTGSILHDGMEYTFWADGSEFWLLNDGNDRPVFVVNLRLQRSD